MRLIIRNPKSGLSKELNTNDYSFKDIDDIIVFYSRIGWKVTLK